MIILIDAYNLLKQIAETSHISDGQRDAFAKSIVQYANHKKHQILLIFDGGSYKRPFTITLSNRVTIIYAGYNQSADAYIIDYIQAHKQQELMLITSDRQLSNTAALHNVITIKSRHFWNIVEAVITHDAESATIFKSDKVVKTTERHNPELDYLMMTHTPQNDRNKEDGIKYSRATISEKKGTKKERILQRYIKKLR